MYISHYTIYIYMRTKGITTFTVISKSKFRRTSATTTTTKSTVYQKESNIGGSDTMCGNQMVFSFLIVWHFIMRSFASKQIRSLLTLVCVILLKAYYCKKARTLDCGAVLQRFVQTNVK